VKIGGTFAAAGRDDDPAAGDGVFAKLRHAVNLSNMQSAV
jgi:hypothetical protein